MDSSAGMATKPHISDRNIDTKQRIPKYIIGRNWEKNGGITAKTMAMALMMIPLPVSPSARDVASSALLLFFRSLNHRAEK